MTDPGIPTHAGLIGELDISIDTGKIYVCTGKDHRGDPEWVDAGLDLRFLHQQVHTFQPKHDTLPQTDKEELYWLTNMLLYLERRYNDKLPQSAPAAAPKNARIPRF